ncbi:hypothetical protein KR215_002996, partial [Drosophila sulfurigaster]
VRDSRHMFALVQEPYVDRKHGITGIPAGMRVFADRRLKAAIFLDDPDAICMPIESLITNFGVCVSVTGRFGSIFLSSVYCQYNTDLEPYLAYLDSVLLLAGSNPVICGMDANAVSPLWFSKSLERARGDLNRRRGELLTEWIQESRAGVLNEVSSLYTFDNHRGRSDIDVTIANEVALMWATYDWR